MKHAVICLLSLGYFAVLCDRTDKVKNNFTDMEHRNFDRRPSEEELDVHWRPKRAAITQDMLQTWSSVKLGISSLRGSGSRRDTEDAFSRGLAGMSGFDWLDELKRITVFRLEPGEKPPSPCHQKIGPDGKEVCVQIPEAKWASSRNRRTCERQNSARYACQPRTNYPDNCYCIALPEKVTTEDINNCYGNAKTGEICNPYSDAPKECYCKNISALQTIPRPLLVQDIERCWTPFERCIPDIFDPDTCSCPDDPPKRQIRSRVNQRSMLDDGIGLFSAMCFDAAKCTDDVP